MVESLAGTLRDLAAIVLLAFALVSPLRAAPPPVSAVAMPPVDRHATDVVATVHP